MKLTLSGAAVAHFDQQASLLCAKLRKRVSDEPRGLEEHGSSEAEVPKRTFDESNARNIRLTGSRDGLGRELSRCFQTPEGYVELAGDDYQSFEQLVSQVLDADSLADSLSEKFVRSCLFDWLEARHKKTIPEDAGFVEHLATRVREDVQLRRVAIPLDSLSIEEPFTIGRVSFDWFRKEFFDSFEEFLLSQKKNDAGQVRSFVAQLREEYQGRVYASIVAEADVERAIELAKLHVDESLMLLRFFSPTALLPEIPCYFDMLGRVSVPTLDTLVFTGNAEFPSVSKRVDEERQFVLPLGSRHLKEMRELGLDAAGALLTKSARTELEELLLTCMSLVARATRAKEFHEKIVFTLAAAETLLLANLTEPIQQSLGLRLAFLTSDTLDGRKAVITMVKDAYKCRSAYLHHGRQIGDLRTTKELQVTVWAALRNVLINLGKATTQRQFIEFIENRILS